MAFYESVFIARQDISTTQVEQLADELTEVLKTGGAEVAKREMWGLKSLTYRIKKNRKGHYVLFNIDGSSEAVAEYERIMRFNEDVIRYMTVRVNELDSEPSAMMQSKQERGGRGGRGPRNDGPRNDGPRGGAR
ncbi:30S ribosomal protein S6 [Rhodovibrionaceae bacterium A322]